MNFTFSLFNYTIFKHIVEVCLKYCVFETGRKKSVQVSQTGHTLFFIY